MIEARSCVLYVHVRRNKMIHCFLDKHVSLVYVTSSLRLPLVLRCACTHPLHLLAPHAVLRLWRCKRCRWPAPPLHHLHRDKHHILHFLHYVPQLLSSHIVIVILVLLHLM